MLVNEYKLYVSIQFKKVRKMQNLGNVYTGICRSPFVMSRTDARNGLYSIFKIVKKYIFLFQQAKSKNKNFL
jgi:hypothetical protein